MLNYLFTYFALVISNVKLLIFLDEGLLGIKFDKFSVTVAVLITFLDWDTTVSSIIFTCYCYGLQDFIFPPTVHDQ